MTLEVPDDRDYTIHMFVYSNGDYCNLNQANAPNRYSWDRSFTFGQSDGDYIVMPATVYANSPEYCSGDC